MAGTLNCYRHPQRETNVSCSACDRPICTDCMVYSPVGIKCPECSRLPSSAIVRLKHVPMAKAIAAAIVGGLAIGLVLAYLQQLGLFFSLILGYFAGLGMGELVLWASGRYRGRETARIAALGALFGYCAPFLFRYGFELGAVADTLARAPFALLGAGIAAYVAYNRVT